MSKRRRRAVWITLAGICRVARHRAAVDATDWRAEQARRPVVVNRKVSNLLA